MRLLATLLLASSIAAQGQFQILDAKTTASLRGIDAVSPQIAWASGSSGTVLLTTDGGATWKHCATPEGAEKLDLRGVQAYDAMTAVIMASGKGRASAIYKTTDGCATWKMVFANPDPDGFFDDIQRVPSKQIYVLGDQVGGKFSMFYSPNRGANWFVADGPGLEADKGDGAFAASNSGLIAVDNMLYFGTGGAETAHIYSSSGTCYNAPSASVRCPLVWTKHNVPAAAGSSGAGVFALAGYMSASLSGKPMPLLVAVGGDYEKPDATDGTALITRDGVGWVKATTPPHGYRSAVAFVAGVQVWIAVGPNGTDISRDDGKNWSPLKPSASDAADADKNWNAISLPFVVGSRGKIGKLTAKF